MDKSIIDNYLSQLLEQTKAHNRKKTGEIIEMVKKRMTSPHPLGIHYQLRCHGVVIFYGAWAIKKKKKSYRTRHTFDLGKKHLLLY